MGFTGLEMPQLGGELATGRGIEGSHLERRGLLGNF
jgi:hypothetical protein